jgi:5-methylcytosine-specific restriction endonuclease McrA
MATSITCSICSKTYKSKQGYDRHLEFKRCNVKDCSHECSYCDKIFSTKNHRETHEIKCLQLNDNIKINALEEEVENLQLFIRQSQETQIIITIYAIIIYCYFFLV